MQLRQTRNELEAANLALRTMQNEPGIPEMRRAWQDFLNRIEKVWNKVKLECGEGSVRPFSRIPRAYPEPRRAARCLAVSRVAIIYQNTSQPVALWNMPISFCFLRISL